MESESDILLKLWENDKSHLQYALALLNEGYLTYVREHLLQFVREADMNIKNLLTKGNWRDKNNFLEVVHYNVFNDKEF